MPYHETKQQVSEQKRPHDQKGISRAVEEVGHHIPENVLRRRFALGKRKFENAYGAVVDAWAVYDNSHDEPTLIEWREQE